MNRSIAVACGAAAVMLSCVLVTPNPALAQVEAGHEGLEFLDTGPLRIREQFLLSQPFVAFDPSSADVLENGHWQLDLVQSGTNTWSHSRAVDQVLKARDQRAPLTLAELRAIQPEHAGKGLYYADGELYRTSLSVRRGLPRNFQLSVTVPLLSFQGGFGDRWIEDFHNNFGFGQSGRLGVPRNRYTVYLRDSAGHEVYRNQDPGTNLGDVVVGLKKELPRRGAWRFAVEGIASAPTGDKDDLYGSGSPELGTQFLGTRYFPRSAFHFGVGAIYNDASKVFPVDAQVLGSGFVTYERALGETWSGVIQGTVTESPFRDLNIDLLDQTAYLVDVGVKKGLNPNAVLFAAFTENIINIGSAPDFGLHVGLTYTR